VRTGSSSFFRHACEGIRVESRAGIARRVFRRLRDAPSSVARRKEHGVRAPSGDIVEALGRGPVGSIDDEEDADTSAAAGAPTEPAAEHPEQIGYLIASIRDIQSTIRAIDTKVGILLAALSLPLRYTSDLFGDLRSGHPSWLGAITVTGLGLYLLSGVVAIRTIAGIGSTVGRVRGANRYNNFYAGGLYRFGPGDAFLNRQSVVSDMTLAEFVEKLPASITAIAADLSAEIMALAYIRDLKLRRQSTAFAFAGLAAIVALARLALGH
jgi:hypothetical protein